MKIQPQPGSLQPGLPPDASAQAAAASPQPLPSVPKEKSVSPASAAQQNLLSSLEALEEWRGEDESRQGASLRWTKDKMPLAVFVADAPEADESAACGQGQGIGRNPGVDFLAVMRQWEAVSEGQVRFELVAVPAQADIVFDWTDETTLGRDFEVGHTDRRVEGSRILHVTITLIRNPKIDTRLSPVQRKARLTATVLHETGHALGLEHAKAEADVMHHRGWRNTTLTPSDIHRLQTLYPASPGRMG